MTSRAKWIESTWREEQSPSSSGQQNERPGKQQVLAKSGSSQANE